MINVKKFSINGPILIDIKKFQDDRGFFSERFKKSWMAELELNIEFIQDNFSRSSGNVLRGLHYQFDQPQGKLVTCLRGKIFDVAVDIRKDSSTLGQSVSVELNGDNPQWFWIPAGFAHGFAVLSPEGADLLYKVDNFYNAKGEGAICWNDSDLNIPWPLTNPLISPKDEQAKSFKNYLLAPKF